MTDAFLKQSGATDRLEKSLSDNRIEYVVYDKTRPNPTVDNVDEALNLYKKHGSPCF